MKGLFTFNELIFPQLIKLTQTMLQQSCGTSHYMYDTILLLPT